MMDDRIKALNTLELAHIAGEVDLDTIMKARNKAGVYSDTPENRKLHRVGEPYKKRTKKVEGVNPETLLAESHGMVFEKYSDSAMLIRGNTYDNVELLRKVRDELKVGGWNSALRGWIFPLKNKAQVLGYFISSTDNDEQKEDFSLVKNSYSIGTRVQGKTQNGTIEGFDIKDGKITYSIKTDDGKVFNNIPERLIQVLPEKDDKKIQEELIEATPESRINTELAINGTEKTDNIRTTQEVIQKEIEKVDKIQEDHKLTPIEAKQKFVDFKNGVTHPVKDYTDIKAIEILLPKEKDVLKKERPAYIPEIDEKSFRSKGHVFDSIKIEENKYLVALGGYSKLDSIRKYNQFTNAWEDVPHNNDLAIMTLDQLAATQQYYRLKSKVELKEKEKDSKRKSRISIISDRRANYSSMYMFEDATGQRGRGKEFWTANSEQYNDIKQKVVDISLQQEEIENSYSKGLETSYGDKGTKDDLLKDYGVKVKRQNGDEISTDEIGDIKKALDDVYSVFGSKNGINKEFNLKISHAGEKNMFARKAVGIFYPSFNAIGVTFSTPKRGGITLSHEYAHFMDYWVGKTTGNHYGSDSQGSISNQIASTFRKNMNQKQTSDYQTRTCECFARAFEQYFDKRKYGENYESKTYDNHVADSKFKEHIEPLIEKYLNEYKDILKSVSLDIIG